MTIDNTTEQRDALAERLFGSVLAAMDVFMVYIGDRLGYYQALSESGPMTSSELADRTGTAERYAREWLEQQAVTSILEADVSKDDSARQYSLPTGHAEVLLDRNSLSYMAPLARMAVGSAQPMPAILDAFRTGGGVSWENYGADAREGQSDMNRPQFLHLMATEWLPNVPGLDARLRADPPARVADVACGGGWSSIAIAQGYPNVRVDGFDLDAPSIDLARSNAEEAGLGDRVSFQVRDAGDPALSGQYDLVTVFEAIHDMSQPVGALRAMRNLAGHTGTVIVMDERVAEEFTAPGDEIERFMYGWSILCCLPAGMADQPSAGTGTVMRPSTLRGYAVEAGFRDIEVLPIKHDAFRFYRLVQ